ncbi:hypothetical protein H310_01925 [Aphanomyces invadans]|uniref:Uncharacterized protein n=1 Tax=Aphanomyces invadans TaxID=157072 RepID=A0A024UMN7_9STRA|nr:hypothetical protein H310_01925 [Aphanomyces invadans]ETW07400.1 hypothetical protein H310_01925 [Aphanomyces invadans]|eukprot:XP_008863493.1 hypothetical protein H310_01925 [Aphanomyces invadans]
MASFEGEAYGAISCKANAVLPQYTTQQQSSFFVAELMKIRAEVREQVALLHAKIDAATRLHSDAQCTLKNMASEQVETQKHQQHVAAASDKILRSFAQDFEARLGMVEQRVASHHSLQTMNEDLMRLKLSDKDACNHNTDHRYHDIAAQVEATDRRVASLCRAHDALAEQLRQAHAKWTTYYSDHDLRIAQTFDLANALSSGQTLLEEKHALEAQVVASQLNKMFQRLHDMMDKQNAGHQGLERCLENVNSELATMQTLHDVHAAEMRDQVTALRRQCHQNSTALRLLADEVVKLKRAKAEEIRRMQCDKSIPPRPTGRRHSTLPGDNDKELMAELDHALRHTSFTTPCFPNHERLHGGRDSLDLN